MRSRLLTSFVIVMFLLACKSKQSTTSVVTIQNNKVDEPVMVLDTLEVLPYVPETKVYNASATRHNDLLHTKLEVKFNWEKQQLMGVACLTLTPYFYSTDSLILDAKAFTINSVSLLQNDKKTELKYSYNKEILSVKLDKKYSKGDKYTVCIDYTANPEEVKSIGSAAIQGAKGLYFINANGKEKNKPMQIWTQGETESNSCWFPTIDKPNERMTQELYITVDKKYTTLSNGLLVYSKENADGTKTDYWKQELPAAPYLTMMAVGEFALVKDKWKNKWTNNTIEVNYYVEKKYEPFAKNIFGNTPEMLEFYSKVLGTPYPWEKYSQIVVRDYVSGAMENTTAVIHGEFLHSTDRELIDRDNEDIIAHELFHHWFGDYVTCESWSNLPLNESFATYGEYLWNEYKYGRDEADMHAKNSAFGYFNEASRKRVHLIRYDYNNKEDMFDGHSYNKGGAVLHMLRKYVGDEAFFAALKLYLESNKYKAAEIHNLRLAFEEVTGEDLNWFFNQWFLSSGHPELIISHKYDSVNGKYTLSVKQKQDLKKHPVFKLPVGVDIYVNGKVVHKNIVIEKHEQSFEFPVSQKPDLVNFDSEKMLLASIDETKSLEEWAFQYHHAPLYSDRMEALLNIKKQATNELAKKTIFDALTDKHWDVRMEAIKALNEVHDNTTHSAIKEKLTSIAQNDTKSLNRAEALELLINLYGEEKDLYDLYVKSLNDKSYAVLGQALKGITKLNKDEGLKTAAKYENEESESLLLQVASIYAKYGSDEKNSFFLRIAPKFTGFSVIGFSTTYVEFLKNAKPETIETALPVFENIAVNESSKWVKYFGKKAVNDLIKHYERKEEELSKKINDLKATDPAATGLVKMEQDLKEIIAFKEKLTAKYEEIKSK